MGELLPADAPSAGQLGGSLDDTQLYAEYRRLAAEQAALRRLATLVARGAEPSEVFDAVVKEMRRCLLAERAGLWRYETSGEITLIAADLRSPAPAKWPVGTRTPIDGGTLAAMVQRTGRPARIDSYEDSAGSTRRTIRGWAWRAAVGVPVIVDGRAWGLAAVGSVDPGPMPADTEARISGFAELIGTAVMAGYRDEQKRQMLDDTSRHSFLIDSLLEGRVFDDCSLGEVAGYLRLPKDGPFVVIAAEVCSRWQRAAAGHRIEAAQSRRVFGMAAAARLAGRDCARRIRAATRQCCRFVVSDGSRPRRSERAIRRSARDAAGFALRQGDVAGPPRPLPPGSRCSTEPSWPPPHSPPQR